ncbi:hypothetical protein AKL17_3p0149 (plasmid) [Frigidibacter mobilis]|uniref:Uncharacterized protein n=1 Tax=Frigidibacter mobilis TaxID=1335048 RepID=A0A159Z9N6_9RHOB|nr:hypothetical protein AKL17_3p0149 [Frigidibacter mobilis]
MLHGTTEIAGFPQKLYKTLQAMASKTAAFQRKIVSGQPRPFRPCSSKA